MDAMDERLTPSPRLDEFLVAPPPAPVVAPRWTIVLSDTDNGLESVHYSLWIAGVCDRAGRWREEVRGVRIVHTGDWLSKQDPEPRVVDYFWELQETAPPECPVIMLQGNHEVEILKRAALGDYSHLTHRELDFIRAQLFLYAESGVLYLHGYPTVNLLLLLHQLRDEGADVNDFNRRMWKPFHEGRYALFRDEAGLEFVGDVRQVKKWFTSRDADGETYGRRISRLLKGLGIHTVIHGHRPNSFLQVDDEFYLEVPGIRMIDNDNQVKLCGLGAALVNDRGAVRFVNLKEMYLAGGEKAFRKQLRQCLELRAPRGKKSLPPELASLPPPDHLPPASGATPRLT
ncbi:MAG: metallophosphoesterase [Magnetococcales bacterium]|nr:metallophosphoesterase [Magnetococcales bacterium]